MNNKLKEIAVRLQQILDQITLLQNEYQSLYQEKEKLISLEEKKIRIIYQQKKDFYYFLKGLLDELIPLLMVGKIAVENLVILLLVQMSGNMAFVTNLKLNVQTVKAVNYYPSHKKFFILI